MAPDEPPTVVLEDKEQQESPFQKLFEKEVEKFKIKIPEPLKKNLGRGKVQIMKGVFGVKEGETEGGVTLCKLIFKNTIGKILFDGTISAKFSKSKKVEEKAYKNQFKVAVVQKGQGEDKKNQVLHCLVNFSRSDDLVEFQKAFTEAVDALKEANK